MGLEFPKTRGPFSGVPGSVRLKHPSTVTGRIEGGVHGKSS